MIMDVMQHLGSGSVAEVCHNDITLTRITLPVQSTVVVDEE